MSAGGEGGWSGASGLRLVIWFGVISFFADLTYEGGRSIVGPYLAVLGASGLVVGGMAGFGELVGYAVRLASGRLADLTRRYWPLTLAGYLVQLPAVPALALAPGWPAATALVIVERIGKGTRNPPRNTMLAAAGEDVGQGWAFGLHQALDQAGALTGPLAVAGVLAAWAEGYRLAFSVLLLPALAALLVLLWVRLHYPQAGAAAPRATDAPTARFAYPREFWWYAGGAAAVAFGFADFPLISYHFTKAGTVTGLWVPVFYALAMGASGLASLLLGRLFDRFGLIVLAPLTGIVAIYAPLVFFGGFLPALAGALLWGIGLGTHESVMSAAVAKMVPAERRATAFGLFMAIFGAAWFVGSAAQGALYDVSITALVALALVAQVFGIVPIVRAYALQERPTGGAAA